MKTNKFATVIQPYSLERGKIGEATDSPEITEHASGKAACVALNAAINRSTCTPCRYHIRTPDGRLLPLDAAYTEIFGVSPVYRDNRATSYPKLKA